MDLNVDTDYTLINYPKSMLTTRQQGEVRSRLMTTATAIANQLDGYVKTDTIVLNTGKEIKMSPARLQAYRLVLERTIPTLSATEIKHKSSLESLSTDALVVRLASLAKQRPELSAKLLEALGGRVIEPDRRETKTVVEERVEQAKEQLTIDADCRVQVVEE